MSPKDLLPLVRPSNGHLEDVVGARGFVVPFARGRDALMAAVGALADVGSSVWVPAFICPDVIELLQHHGKEVLLYPVDRGLLPDLTHVGSRIREGDLFVVVSYFGLIRPTGAIRSARSAGALVIEDSCQSPFLYGHDDEDALPDMAFTSLRKYAPVPDGALLDVHLTELQEGLAEPGPMHWGFTAWRTVGLLARGVYQRRPRRVYAALAQELMVAAERQLRRGSLGLGMSGLARRCLLRTDLNCIREARVRNYQALVEAISGCSQVRPLLPRLPANACPFGCPLIVPNNRLWGDALNRRGICAAILWDREDHWEGFPWSRWLAEHLLVVPVSQTYGPDDMQRIGAVIREYDRAE